MWACKVPTPEEAVDGSKGRWLKWALAAESGKRVFLAKDYKLVEIMPLPTPKGCRRRQTKVHQNFRVVKIGLKRGIN